MSAHFFDDKGVSRPGIEVAVGLKHGEAVFTVMVRVFLADGVGAAARGHTNRLAHMAMDHVFDRLDEGWRPDQGALPPITIS